MVENAPVPQARDDTARFVRQLVLVAARALTAPVTRVRVA